MIGQFSDVLTEFEQADGIERVTMVEALSEDLSIQDLMRYYDSCDFAFNFNFVQYLHQPLSPGQLVDQTLDWLKNMPEGKTANWVVSALEYQKTYRWYSNKSCSLAIMTTGELETELERSFGMG